jgi:hypothetical protein
MVGRMTIVANFCGCSFLEGERKESRPGNGRDKNELYFVLFGYDPSDTLGVGQTRIGADSI